MKKFEAGIVHAILPPLDPINMMVTSDAVIILRQTYYGGGNDHPPRSESICIPIPYLPILCGGLMEIHEAALTTPRIDDDENVLSCDSD